MQKRIVIWVAAALGGTILLALVSLLAVSRAAVRKQALARIEAEKSGARAESPGLPGLTPQAVSDTVTPEQPDSEPSRVEPNVGPVESLPPRLTAAQRAEARRAALEVVLRKGIFYEVKEQNPRGIRFMVGSPFFAEPQKYRNPLLRQLYYVYGSGRPAGQPPLYLEFWDLKRKFGEYVADTFYFGPRYAKPR